MTNALLVRRRGMIQAQQGGLPYDAEIEYLEGDGYAYIDTLYNANSDTSVEINLRAKTPTQAMGICSIKYDCLFSLYQLLGNSSYQFRFQVGYSSDVSATLYNFQSNNSFNNDYIFELRKNEFLINTVVRNTFTADTFSSEYTIPLFAARLSNGIDSRRFNGRIYYCKILDDVTLVRDFIPVRVGTVGYMYDRVSGQLFGNAGTGSFMLGPDVI